MTNKQTKEFERIAELLNTILPIPTDGDIDRVILRLEDRLANKRINQQNNIPVRDGYVKAVEILKSRQKNDKGIIELRSIQSRAIAMCAIDYLNGECSEEVLCSIPLTKRY